MSNKEYIGDGVYAEFNGYALILTTENGVFVTNRIFLEAPEFKKVTDYMKRQVPPR